MADEPRKPNDLLRNHLLMKKLGERLREAHAPAEEVLPDAIGQALEKLRKKPP